MMVCICNYNKIWLPVYINLRKIEHDTTAGQFFNIYYFLNYPLCLGLLQICEVACPLKLSSESLTNASQIRNSWLQGWEKKGGLVLGQWKSIIKTFYMSFHGSWNSNYAAWRAKLHVVESDNIGNVLLTTTMTY